MGAFEADRYRCSPSRLTLDRRGRSYLKPPQMRIATKPPNLGRIGALPCPRQTAGEPILLTGNIIKDLGKSQTFEPIRSPGAEVSLRVIAVDNDWLVRLECSSSLAIELLQWDIYRPGQVFCLIFFLREDLDKLRPQKTESKIYANSYFYDYAEDGHPLALTGIFFAFTFDNSAGAVPG